MVPVAAGSNPVDHPIKYIHSVTTKIKSKVQSTIITAKPLHFFEEFIQFIKNFGVIGLAIGVIIGQTTNNLVTSIVNNLISPILGKLIGINDIKNWAPEGIKIGAFISDFINFIAILFVVYVLIRFLLIYILTEDEKKKFEFLAEEKEVKKTKKKS